MRFTSYCAHAHARTIFWLTQRKLNKQKITTVSSKWIAEGKRQERNEDENSNETHTKIINWDLIKRKIITFMQNKHVTNKQTKQRFFVLSIDNRFQRCLTIYRQHRITLTITKEKCAINSTRKAPPNSVYCLHSQCMRIIMTSIVWLWRIHIPNDLSHFCGAMCFIQP